MTSEVVTEGDECAAADGQDFLIEVGVVAEGEFQDAIGHFDGDQRGARIDIGRDQSAVGEDGVDAPGEIVHAGPDMPGHRRRGAPAHPESC